MTLPLLARLPDDATGPARAEHRCAGCGYGVILSDPPPACPMCHANSWDRVVREPLAHPDRLGAETALDELAARRLRPRRRRR